MLLTDTYSHTAAGAFWPNHEWLSQVIFYGLYRLGGLPLLSLFAAALIVTAWIITWHVAGGPVLRRLAILLPCPRPGQRTLGAAAARVLAALPAAGRMARPAAPVLLVDPAVLRLGQLSRRRAARSRVSGGGPGGGVVPRAGASRAATLKTIGLALAGCVAAVSLTPLGLSFWIEIPKSLARIRQYPLDEWLAPRLSEIPLAPFWVLAVGLLRPVGCEPPSCVDPPAAQTAILCLPALVLLPMALSAVRNVGPFLMFAAPAICGLLPERTFARAEQARTQNRPALNLGLAAVATLMAVVAIGTRIDFMSIISSGRRSRRRRCGRCGSVPITCTTATTRAAT